VKGDVSVQVVAKLYNVSEANITRKCQAGIFPNAYQIGGEKCQWHIPVEDVMAAIPAPRHETARQKLELLARLQEMRELQQNPV
jgi:hypothetical protein